MERLWDPPDDEDDDLPPDGYRVDGTLPAGTVVYEGEDALESLEAVCRSAVEAGEHGWPTRSFSPGHGEPFAPDLHTSCPDHLVDVLTWLQATSVLISHRTDLSERPNEVY